MNHQPDTPASLNEAVTDRGPRIEHLCRAICAYVDVNPDQVLDFVDGKPTKLAWHRHDLQAARLLRELDALAAPGAAIDAREQEVPFGIIDPDYARYYTLIRTTAWQCGYAIGLHGSFTRDLDLIAVPWTAQALPPDLLIKQVEYRTDLRRQEEAFRAKPHGRMCWSLLLPGFTDPRWIDLSVMPALASREEAPTPSEALSPATVAQPVAAVSDERIKDFVKRYVLTRSEMVAEGELRQMLAAQPCASQGCGGAEMRQAAEEAIQWLNSWFRNHDGNKVADKLRAALSKK